MRAMPFKHLALGLPLLAVGCAGGERAAVDPAPTTAPYSAAASIPALPSISAAAYISNAASIDLFAIRSAQIAFQRSADPRTREFATMVLAAHRGTSSQLSLAGRRLNLLPGAELNERHAALMNELIGAANFDATYRRIQIEVHDEALSLHRNYASRGASPTLRPVAAAAVPIVERHLRILRTL